MPTFTEISEFSPWFLKVSNAIAPQDIMEGIVSR